MMRQSPMPRRAGALTVEAAIVYPVFLTLLLCLIVGGMGVFQYQQVACQAREAARWASVRGRRWADATNQASPTQQQILQNAVLPFAGGIDPSKLTIQVQWIDESTGQVYPWNTASKYPVTWTNTSQLVTNKVRVTITCQWLPGIFGLGAMSLTSTSEVPMAF